MDVLCTTAVSCSAMMIRIRYVLRRLLFSLVSCEVAHRRSTIPGVPGMIQQRRRRDVNDSHDETTCVLMAVSPPLATHTLRVRITRRR